MNRKEAVIYLMENPKGKLRITIDFFGNVNNSTDIIKINTKGELVGINTAIASQTGSYSGYSFALRYCLANWQIRNKMVYQKLLQTVHPGILKNYEESDRFWKAYETPIEKGFHLFYDRFLKWNQQKDGIESYSKLVNLMVNYYKNKSL